MVAVKKTKQTSDGRNNQGSWTDLEGWTGFSP